MKHASLFSGIGGFDLAAEWMGWENKFHCEIDAFCQNVLKYYWPNAESFTDITKTDFSKYANKIDVLTGGFPCQPYSLAGKRKGKDDERHLWPEMLRSIREIRPRWVVGENVFGLVNWSEGLVFHEVQADLEAEGYEVFPYVLPAAAVNAPHRRDRIWFVAYCNSIRFNGGECEHEINTGERGVNAQCDLGQGLDNGNASNTENTGQQTRFKRQGQKQSWGRDFAMGSGQWDRFPTQSPVCSGDDGLLTKLDGITFSKWRNESIKAAGNAIVPQVVYQIFKTIKEYENLKK